MNGFNEQHEDAELESQRVDDTQRWTDTDLCDAHTKTDGSYWVYDGRGIPLARVCARCKKAKLAKFRPDIMTAYDCDEPIEPEDV